MITEYNERKTMETYRVSCAMGMEVTREEYTNIVNKAQESIHIVCGEFDPVFYNSDGFINAVEKFISYQGKDISIIFNGAAKSEKEAIKKLKSENKRFINMLKTPDDSLSDIVHFYWASKRPNQHYAIIDDRTSIIEESHEERRPRDLYIIKEDTGIASKWQKMFQKIKKYCSPISVSELIN